MSNQEKITDQRASTTDTLSRFLGGSPLAVLGKLILLSVLIGFVLHAFGLNPFNIIESIQPPNHSRRSSRSPPSTRMGACPLT